MSAAPRVTIMIATHNRVGELVKTLESCEALTGVSKEILVVDDSSTDGTSDVVRKSFPKVNLLRNEINKGSIASRNDILQRARGDYIIGLDDDSRFVAPNACERITARMDAEPEIGIMACQIIGPEYPETLQPHGQSIGEWHCSSFACCGVAIRRSMLERTGLFPEIFFHAYEEPDLALRAWDAGYRVLQWNEIVVYHEFTRVSRNERRVHQRHARNEACSVVMRYPWQWVFPAVVTKLAGQARYALRRGWFLQEPRVWGEVLWRLPRVLRERRAVSRDAVKIAVGLNRRQCVEAAAARHLATLPWSELLRRERHSGNRRSPAPAASAVKHPCTGRPPQGIVTQHQVPQR
jgi:glycosyltransferase involved in cell wall biosynthesis